MRVIKKIAKSIRRTIDPNAKARKRERRKQERNAKFASARWQHGGEVAKRSYAGYEDYLHHQSTKLDNIIDRLQEKQDADFEDFVERFRACSILSEARTVLCLGARLGTEVRALHELGYFAVGIDLNPGPDNNLVIKGDFHEIVFPDDSVDAIYTNSLDHVFELEKVISETRRVLRPDGLFIVDLMKGYEEGFLPGDYEAMVWQNSPEFVEKICAIGGFRLDALHEFKQSRRNDLLQAAMRKTVQNFSVAPAVHA